MFALTRSRLVVLGLDGLPLDLARSLCATHPERFPNLSRLAPDATAMYAELPELSPVNWSSFATGAGPEEHGVLGFTSVHPCTYALSVADAAWLRTPTIFDRMGERGLVSRIVNLPNMYPARPLRGTLIAGFVAPDLPRAVYPPELVKKLTAFGYKLEADTVRGKDDPAYLLAELRATLASRRQALDLLWPDLDWDLFVFVLTETDRLFHFHYPALENARDPLHVPCLELMQQWDACVGEVLERYDALPEPKRLLVMADHGFCALTQEVDINAWLREHGFLRIRNGSGSPRNEFDARCIHPDSQAFALDPGRVYVHDQRFARGGVPPKERGAVMERIRNGLLALRYEGRNVMEAVDHGERLYPNARGDLLLPDLVCRPAPGFDCKAKFDRERVFGFFGRRGMHTARGAFFYDSEKQRPERVRDVGRFVLEHFGVTPQTPSSLCL